MARRRFDQNKNRVDYGELLIEDSAFELEQAVGFIGYGGFNGNTTLPWYAW